MKRFLKSVIKLGATVGIFVAIFLEFGGGFKPVSVPSLRTPGAFEMSNPAYPGIVGRLRAKLRGAELPPPRVPVSIDEVCRGATEHAVFVRLEGGSVERFKPLRHCTEDKLATVYVEKSDGDFEAVPYEQAPETAYFRIQGLQLVPLELSEMWAEIRSVDPGVFVVWFVLAMLIKLVGIFANIWRWQILLRAQKIDLRFGFLSSTYFIGRYFGIVTPSTMGLDAWRLYETIRLTRRPVECATAVAVERVIGMVGLLGVVLIFMPFATDLLVGQSFGEMIGAMKMPIAAAVALGILVLVQPGWFRGVLGILPGERVRKFAGSAIDAATAYSSVRGSLLLALGLAIFGQVTTTLMYFCNAMALASVNVHPTEVLFASAVMTLGTFVAPSASGEGVREVVFMLLIGNKTGAAKAFLIGHLGFWIEKGPLSIPGGLILLLRRDPTLRAVTREDLERLRRETEAEAAPS